MTVLCKRWITSCLGLGWMPVASGTWGSLPVAVTVGVLLAGGHTAWLGWALGAWLLFGAVSCVLWTPAAVAAVGRSDPGEVVVDEVAGQAVCFLVWRFGSTTVRPEQAWVLAAAGFLLFRLFDIFKPQPVRRLEALPAGWGVLADDLMAGLYAGGVLLGFVWLVRWAGTTPVASAAADLTWPVALGLGALQGVTEFLPVSSSGHLVLTETLLGLAPERDAMLVFDLATHLGTVLAVVMVMARPLRRFLGDLAGSWRQWGRPLELYRRRAAVRFFVLAVVGTVVTAVPGLLLQDRLEQAREHIGWVGLCWFVTATVLLASDRFRAHRSLRRFGLPGAVGVGLAQFAAVLPGVSRSGSTVCAAVVLGRLHRRWAVEYSMLLGVMAILGASGLEFVRQWDHLGAGPVDWASLVAGTVAAFGVGIVALKWLIRAVRRARLRPFAFYCYLLAVFALFWAWF